MLWDIMRKTPLHPGYWAWLINWNRLWKTIIFHSCETDTCKGQQSVIFVPIFSPSIPPTVLSCLSQYLFYTKWKASTRNHFMKNLSWVLRPCIRPFQLKLKVILSLTHEAIGYYGLYFLITFYFLLMLVSLWEKKKKNMVTEPKQ